MVTVLTDVRYRGEEIVVNSVSEGLTAIIGIPRDISASGLPAFCLPHKGDSRAFDILASEDQCNARPIGQAIIVDF